MDWQQALYLLGAGLMAWLAVRLIKSNPQSFSRVNISKSVTTCGILALILFAVIALCVWGLRSS